MQRSQEAGTMQRRAAKTATSRTRRVRPVRRGGSAGRQQGGSRDMVIGGLVCVVGIIITVATYSAATSDGHGGTYVVTWGAILFGGIQFCRGIYHSMG
jgi:hypothetical protein